MSALSHNILSHARVGGLDLLIRLKQVDSDGFVKNLMQMFSKTNYLQELMVVKAFQTSIEVSKAIEFMDELMTLHEQYCSKAKKFARE